VGVGEIKTGLPNNCIENKRCMVRANEGMVSIIVLFYLVPDLEKVNLF
jgi:hypothetical protein